ncbi:acyl-CoA synthetase, partial [Spirillospora sp. NPDC049652]
RFVPRGDDTAVLDHALRPVAPGSGEIGQLARRGRIPLGYWNDEAKTAKTFVTDDEGTRWALQGDMARVEADGSVVLLGRGSLVVNTGGEKVFVEEVEAALKTHPAVYDALVVGVPDERLGSRVAAVVSLGPGASATPEELVAHTRRTLAGYKVPRDLKIVDRVRRSPAGKADYRWAKGLYQ